MNKQNHNTATPHADDAELREALASVPRQGVRLCDVPANSALEPYLQWCEASLDAWAEDATKRSPAR